MFKTTTPQELNDHHRNGEPLDLIDVRTPMEFEEVHVDFARNVPLDQLDPASFLKERSTDPARPLYVICRAGSRGKRACEALLAAGHASVVNVEGGTAAWEAAGLPVTRGRRGMSLERQVRIVAGLLVVVGTALGFFVHSALLGLPAFVGTGLVIAGITDWCGMGLLLARMPWNQVSVSRAATSASASDKPTCNKRSGTCCG